MAVENASYQVLIKEGPFELRHYEPMIVVTSHETEMSDGDGFNRLFNYISGNNRESKRIAMTAPVINSLEDQQSMTAFVMPSQYRLQDVPQPNDPSLQVKAMQGRRIAAITFSGKVNTEVIERKSVELQAWLQEKHMLAVGGVELARYNPPYIPSYIRRNELLVEIKAAE